MLKIKGNKIYISRGEHASFDITLFNERGETVELEKGAVLYFSVKKRETDENYAIAPKALNGTTLVIEEEDTQDLQFGPYLYDVMLIDSSNDPYYIIDPTLFSIEPVITARGDR